ncbi:MAG: trehalose-6-phosphate synthase [Candidatus Micrarchaeota archaeon]
MQEFASKVKEMLGNKALVLASSSEPYVNYFEEEEIRWRRGTGGVVTALEPVMRSCHGTWIAHGSGEADRELVGNDGKMQLPPGENSYTLRRLFFSKKEQDGFLSGVANGALWPLSHVVYVRPRFIDEQWEIFRGVNRKFAEAISADTGKADAITWINDYQLVLAAKYLKEMEPEGISAYFWHIPWPNPQVFKVCPWHEEILDAMLSNDLIGFNTPYYASNFLESVDQTLEARIDKVTSTVVYKGREISVVAEPISVDYRGIQAFSEKVQESAVVKVAKKYGLRKGVVAIGVDRMDYTKGLPEKIKAIDLVLTRHPEMAEELTLVQIASPTRIHLPEYQQFNEELETLAEEVNWRHSTGSWKPVILDIRYASPEEIYSLYKIAGICLVTSLHDGMNLVSKEYVASKTDGRGVLILSRFAGASTELKDALPVNPYSVNEIADAIEKAIGMPVAERQERMKRMQEEISRNDVFAWAQRFLEKAVRKGVGQKL